MRTFTNFAAQGEITLRRISDDSTDGMTPLDPENDVLIIGHSETGHHHVMDRHHVHAFVSGDAPEGMRILKLIVSAPTALTHQRPHDTHDPLMVPPGVYEARIQREYDPYAHLARRVED